MRGRLLGVSGDQYGHVRVLVDPHDSERDEEGEDLHDGTGSERERREARDDGVAVEDEVGVAGVVEQAAEDVGEEEEPVLGESERTEHTQV